MERVGGGVGGQLVRCDLFEARASGIEANSSASSEDGKVGSGALHVVVVVVVVFSADATQAGVLELLGVCAVSPEMLEHLPATAREDGFGMLEWWQ